MAKDNAEVVYVTELAASGFMNGVINVAFVTYQFLPAVDDDGEPIVAPAPVISANLRFDLLLAQQLRDRLTVIIDENTKARTTS